MWARAQIVDCFRRNSFACVCGDFEQQIRSRNLSVFFFYILIRVFSRNAIHRKIAKLLWLLLLHISIDSYNNYIKLNIKIITYFIVIKNFREKNKIIESTSKGLV
jgi:hypothetical protein